MVPCISILKITLFKRKRFNVCINVDDITIINKTVFNFSSRKKHNGKQYTGIREENLSFLFYYLLF